MGIWTFSVCRDKVCGWSTANTSIATLKSKSWWTWSTVCICSSCTACASHIACFLNKGLWISIIWLDNTCTVIQGGICIFPRRACTCTVLNEYHWIVYSNTQHHIGLTIISCYINWQVSQLILMEYFYSTCDVTWRPLSDLEIS